MANLSEIKPDSRFFGMFMGPSGSGKTGAAISFPKPYDLDIDMRIRGGVGVKEWTPIDDVQYKVFDPSKGFKELEAELEVFQLLLSANKTDRKTLIVDSLTSELRMFLTDAIHLEGGKARQILNLKIAGPAEYNYESEAAYQIFDLLRSLKCNVIITAHVVDRYGKSDQSKEYSENTVIGKKLSVRDKIAVNSLIYFDEVYEFNREETTNGNIKHSVKFRGDVAKTAHPGLGIGWHDVTGKNFYNFWQEKIKGE